MELNKIYNEDCLDTLSKMPNDFIDLVVTSPPYDNLRKYNGFTLDVQIIANQLFNKVKTGGVIVWIVSDATIDGCETLTCFQASNNFC